MERFIKTVFTLSLIFCFCGTIVAQQPPKKKSPKSTIKKEVVSKKDTVQISDSLKQEIELQRGLLLRDTTSSK